MPSGSEVISMTEFLNKSSGEGGVNQSKAKVVIG